MMCVSLLVGVKCDMCFSPSGCVGVKCDVCFSPSGCEMRYVSLS